MTDRAKRFLRSAKTPFFITLSYLEVHHQNDSDTFDPPKEFAHRYPNPFIPPDLRPLPGSWPSQLSDYFACVAKMDETVGEIRNTLRETGLDKNTIVVFLSDHACHFKTRNTEYKRSPHDSSIHIPLVIAGPGFNRSMQISELVSQVDLMPTLLEAAGIAIPPSVQGHSLLPLLDRKTDHWRNEVYFEMSEFVTGRGLRHAAIHLRRRNAENSGMEGRSVRGPIRRIRALRSLRGSFSARESRRPRYAQEGRGGTAGAAACAHLRSQRRDAGHRCRLVSISVTERKMLPGALKILHRAFMFLRRGKGAEGPEILAFARFGVFFPRIEPVFTGFEFSYHARGTCKRTTKSKPSPDVGWTHGPRYGRCQQPVGFLVAHHALLRRVPSQRPSSFIAMFARMQLAVEI